jgi:hypothetical protein
MNRRLKRQELHERSSGTVLFMAGGAVTGLLLVLALMPETKGSAEAVKKTHAKRCD